ncbi:MAG: DsbA family protein [Candidatus Magasanikbacteria bacterium]|nr:DsbA family protein [Candidatus Magasanikbacteria bacterium]
MEEKKSFFELLDGKSAMLVGLVGGILSLGTIGFIILGVKMLNGSSISGGAGYQNLVAAAPSAAQPSQPSAPTAGTPVNVGVGHFPVKGKASAKVTVIEFADFRCPFCERFYKDAGRGIMKDYVDTGKVKFYFRGYAFLGPASTAAAEASECANEQGQFWKFHDWMYDNQAPESDTAYYSKENLITYAVNLGLNRASFASCLNSDKYAAKVNQDLSEGQAAGVNGTPTTFVNGMPIVGAVPYAQIKAAIDQALAQ